MYPVLLKHIHIFFVKSFLFCFHCSVVKMEANKHLTVIKYFTEFKNHQFLTPADEGWGYSCPLLGVPQPKALHRFSPNFQGMFTLKESRAY